MSPSRLENARGNDYMTATSKFNDLPPWVWINVLANSLEQTNHLYFLLWLWVHVSWNWSYQPKTRCSFWDSKLQPSRTHGCEIQLILVSCHDRESTCKQTC
jgi:hypothetical protein